MPAYEDQDQDNPTTAPEVSEEDAEILAEAREKYRYFSDRWRSIRDERKTDLQFISGDPWTAEDRKARADAGRPCINHDELG